MRYYFKIVSKQDETRSFVINRLAATHFFELEGVLQGNEFPIKVRIEYETFETKIVVHQDIRLLLPSRTVKRGETVMFEKLNKNSIKLIILTASQSENVKSYMEDKHFMTNTNLLCQ